MVRGFCCQETAKIVPVGKIDPAAASGALRLPRDIRGPKGLVLEHGECDFDSPDHPNFKTAKTVPVGRIDPGCCVWRSVSPEGIKKLYLRFRNCRMEAERAALHPIPCLYTPNCFCKAFSPGIKGMNHRDDFCHFLAAESSDHILFTKLKNSKHSQLSIC